MATPDFVTILGAFADAHAVFAVATQALEATERHGDIVATLRAGLNLFQTAYDQLDAATRCVS